MTSNLSKLERHARKFWGCSAPDVVLRRYVARAANMPQLELQQHIAHVCAWVALAQPLTDAAKHFAAEPSELSADAAKLFALSPVRVLCIMLRLYGRARLSDRLWAALRAVSSCCSVVLTSTIEAEPEHKADWQELRRCMPILRKRKLQDSQDSGLRNTGDDSEEGSDVAMFKRMRRLNRGMHKWEAYDLDERRTQVLNCKFRLLAICDCTNTDTVQLRKLLYEVIGALSPARVMPRAGAGEVAMSVERGECLRMSAQIQKDVREILTEAISKWRDLALEDVQIGPVLQHIRVYIQDFVEKYGDLELACATKQWKKLRSVIGMTIYEGLQKGKHASYTKAARVRANTDHGIYTPSDRVQQLRHVRKLDKSVVLRCATCGYELQSKWYFCFASKVSVLRPQNGHCAGT